MHSLSSSREEILTFFYFDLEDLLLRLVDLMKMDYTVTNKSSHVVSESLHQTQILRLSKTTHVRCKHLIGSNSQRQEV